MTTEPLDLAAIMAEHTGHHGCVDGWVLVGDPHCLPYRLAERAEKAEARIAAVQEAMRQSEQLRAALGGEQP